MADLRKDCDVPRWTGRVLPNGEYHYEHHHDFQISYTDDGDDWAVCRYCLTGAHVLAWAKTLRPAATTEEGRA